MAGTPSPAAPKQTSDSGQRQMPKLTDFSAKKDAPAVRPKTTFNYHTPQTTFNYHTPKTVAQTTPQTTFNYHTPKTSFNYHTPKLTNGVASGSGSATPADDDDVSPAASGWAKLKMEASGQAVPEKAKFNPKRPPLKENFFERENDEEERNKLLEKNKSLIRSQLLSAGKQGP